MSSQTCEPHRSLGGQWYREWPKVSELLFLPAGCREEYVGKQIRSRQLYTSACSAVEQIRKGLYFISGITSLSVPFYKRDSVYLRFFLTISPFLPTTILYPLSLLLIVLHLAPAILAWRAGYCAPCKCRANPADPDYQPFRRPGQVTFNAEAPGIWPSHSTIQILCKTWCNDSFDLQEVIVSAGTASLSPRSAWGAWYHGLNRQVEDKLEDM